MTVLRQAPIPEFFPTLLSLPEDGRVGGMTNPFVARTTWGGIGTIICAASSPNCDTDLMENLDVNNVYYTQSMPMLSRARDYEIVNPAGSRVPLEHRVPESGYEMTSYFYRATQGGQDGSVAIVGAGGGTPTARVDTLREEQYYMCTPYSDGSCRNQTGPFIRYPTAVAGSVMEVTPSYAPNRTFPVLAGTSG